MSARRRPQERRGPVGSRRSSRPPSVAFGIGARLRATHEPQAEKARQGIRARVAATATSRRCTGRSAPTRASATASRRFAPSTRRTPRPRRRAPGRSGARRAAATTFDGPGPRGHAVFGAFDGSVSLEASDGGVDWRAVHVVPRHARGRAPSRVTTHAAARRPARPRRHAVHKLPRHRRPDVSATSARCRPRTSHG